MRIFYSFLIIVCSTILIILPVTAGIYAFRTDLRTDSYTVTTSSGTTNATVQLFRPIYDEDTSTIVVYSHEETDVPYWNSYNGTTRAMEIIGLSENTTRTIDVTYDVDAIGPGGISGLLNILPWIWILIWVAFPVAGLAAIWTGRAG